MFNIIGLCFEVINVRTNNSTWQRKIPVYYSVFIKVEDDCHSDVMFVYIWFSSANLRV